MIQTKKEKVSDFYNVKDSILKHPATKVILIGGGILLLIAISGYVLKLLNFTMSNYKELQRTIKKT